MNKDNMWVTRKTTVISSCFNHGSKVSVVERRGFFGSYERYEVCASCGMKIEVSL